MAHASFLRSWRICVQLRSLFAVLYFRSILKQSESRYQSLLCLNNIDPLANVQPLLLKQPYDVPSDRPSELTAQVLRTLSSCAILLQSVTNSASSSKCTMLESKPSQVNDLSKFSLKPSNFESTLHSRICFMEYILHVTYNLPFKFRRTFDLPADIKKETQSCIQGQFREKMGLFVVIVKQGRGYTNYGNSARRFF